MQTLYFQIDNVGFPIGVNSTRSSPTDIEIANCPSEVLVFPSNYRVKQVGGVYVLASIVTSEYPYPDRPLKVEILESDLVKLLLDPNYNYIAQSALASPAVQRNGKVIAWFKDLIINYTVDGVEKQQSTDETKAILAVQYPNILVIQNPEVSFL